MVRTRLSPMWLVGARRGGRRARLGLNGDRSAHRALDRRFGPPLCLVDGRCGAASATATLDRRAGSRSRSSRSRRRRRAIGGCAIRRPSTVCVASPRPSAGGSTSAEAALAAPDAEQRTARAATSSAAHRARSARSTACLRRSCRRAAPEHPRAGAPRLQHADVAPSSPRMRCGPAATSVAAAESMQAHPATFDGCRRPWRRNGRCGSRRPGRPSTNSAVRPAASRRRRVMRGTAMSQYAAQQAATERRDSSWPSLKPGALNVHCQHAEVISSLGPDRATRAGALAQRCAALLRAEDLVARRRPGPG